ncbi:hypothetical protein PV328_007912 [Microctonus aethiopoides]|uniref:Splicing factor 3B subunit 1 n=1 Tax=Microctonus aethiopoides TaxID=144406 RepID=A0AA39C9V7_9HYME|nr:hypothetical protein PV328_007912 [Microctonus aethiopoides]
MDSIPRTHEDIEAQIREIQSKKKEIQIVATEKDQVGLGKTGFYDQDIYDGTNNKYDGYVTSIAANDEIEDEDYEPSAFTTNKRPGFTAPAALLNDVAQSEKEYDPFADRRRPTIADREDEYRQKRRRMIISPERVDPFAEVTVNTFGIARFPWILCRRWLKYISMWKNMSRTVLPVAMKHHVVKLPMSVPVDSQILCVSKC